VTFTLVHAEKYRTEDKLNKTQKKQTAQKNSKTRQPWLSRLL